MLCAATIAYCLQPISMLDPLPCLPRLAACWWCRQRLQDVEAKLKAAVQDKNGEQMEKAALEREVKTLRAQNDRISKNIDKVCAAYDASSYLCSKILWEKEP
jgi:hypothetical protein